MISRVFALTGVDWITVTWLRMYRVGSKKSVNSEVTSPPVRGIVEEYEPVDR